MSKVLALVGKPGKEIGRLVIRETEDGISVEGEMSAAAMALAAACLLRLAAKIAMEDGE